MDLLENMNRAMDYIEAHLTEEIDYKELAASALCSVSNFQRFFTYMTDVSLAEYIRRRRLSSAALELQQSDIRIIDLAAKYGYESSASFSRAFLAMHGATPSEARQGKRLKSYPRMTFRFSIKGDTALDYRIVTKPAFHMVGIKERINKKENENLRYMPDFWKKHYNRRDELSKLSSEQEDCFYGITMNYTDQGFDYCIAVMSDMAADQPMNELFFPESKWAVFRCSGPLPEAQYDMWRKIFSEWLPFSGYILAEIPQLERYPKDDIYSPGYESEIWIPLLVKEKD